MSVRVPRYKRATEKGRNHTSPNAIGVQQVSFVCVGVESLHLGGLGKRDEGRHDNRCKGVLSDLLLQ